MQRDELRLELLKLTVPVSAHQGINEAILRAKALEEYVSEEITAPASAAVTSEGAPAPRRGRPPKVDNA